MVGRLWVLRLPLILMAFSSIPDTRLTAAPMAAGEREFRWDVLKSAPIHVQAEVTSPAMGQFVDHPSTCASEAIVRTSFKGADLLPVGARFRLASFCDVGAWYMTGHGAKNAAPASDFSPGALVEVVLVPFVTLGGDRVGTGVFQVLSQGTGVTRIPALSTSPIIDLSEKPSWYNQYYRNIYGSNVYGQDATWRLPRPKNPLRFPQRDVEVGYTVSTQPGEAFVARYDVKRGQVEIQPADKPPGAAGRLILDPVLDLTIRMFDARYSFSIQSSSKRAVLTGDASPQGEDEVAGLRCGKYRMTWTTGVGRETRQRSSDVCVTDDGIVLRRIEDGTVTTASSVSYRPIAPAETRVPNGYSRIPAEDDTKFIPRPLPVD